MSIKYYIDQLSGLLDGISKFPDGSVSQVLTLEVLRLVSKLKECRSSEDREEVTAELDYLIRLIKAFAVQIGKDLKTTATNIEYFIMDGDVEYMDVAERALEMSGWKVFISREYNSVSTTDPNGGGWVYTVDEFDALIRDPNEFFKLLTGNPLAPVKLEW